MTAERLDTVIVDTGVEGLDHILNGGLPANRLYLIEGHPGSGKTTIALQFLLAGVARGERTMYVTLSETKEELEATAASHGWSLEGIDIFELVPSEASLRPDASYMMFHPSETELSDTTQAVLEQATRIRPARLVFDSLSELRLLAQNSLRYRRQILALKQFFARQQCTVIFADDRTADADMHLFSLAHGVISLERRVTEYGSLRRHLQVTKLRGRQFREGWHDARILRGGMVVYPRMVAAEHHGVISDKPMSSGNAELDALLGGGLTPGTSTLIMGPVGTGKSSVGTRFACAAGSRGIRSAVFLFEESRTTYLKRSAGIDMALEPLMAEGKLTLRQIDPAELSAGEFAAYVRECVEEQGVRVVVIDTLNGYMNAMNSEKLVMIHLHELLTYLGQQGVTTILVTAQHGIIGTSMASPVDVSYLADTVLLTRYFEAGGEVRQAIAVIKKRTGDHERTIREMKFDARGMTLGSPLREFRGVMTGVPVPADAPHTGLVRG